MIYPRPTDVEAFEKSYQDEHVPKAAKKLGGKTKHVATKGLASPQGTPPFHPPTQEATAINPWRKAQRVSFEALAKEDTLRRASPKSQEGPRLQSRGAPPHRRDSLPVDGSSGGFRCFSRNKEDIGACRVYFHGRKTDFLSR